MAAKQLFNEFVDVEVLEQQKAKVISMFSEIKDGIKELNGLGLNLSSSKSLKDAIKTSEEYKRVFTQLSKVQQDYAKVQIALAKAEEQLEKLRERSNSSSGRGLKLTTEEKLRKSELLKLEKERIRLRNTDEGSIDQLNIKLAKATRIVNGLSESYRNTPRGQTLVTFTEDLANKVNDLQKKAGNFRNNIGRYTESLAGGFEKVRQEIERLKLRQSELQDLTGGGSKPIEGFHGGLKGGGATTAQVKELEQVNSLISKLERTNQIGFKTNQSYATSVRQIERAYQDLATSGGVSEQFLKDFKKFAAEAKDQAQDLKDEIKALSSDTRGFDLISGGINSAISAVQVGVGVNELFGKSSEDVQKSIQKLVAIQNIATGVREFANEATKHGTLLNKAFAGVQLLVATALDKSAASAKRWAAAAGIFGLVVTVIGAVVVALTLFNKKLSDSEKAQKAIKEAMEEANQEIGAQVGELQALYKITQDSNQSLETRRKASNKLLEINKENNKRTGESIKLLTDQNGILKEQPDLIDKIAESLIRQTKTKAFLNLIEKAYTEVLNAQNASLTSQTNKLEDFALGFNKIVSGMFGVKAPGAKEVQKALHEKGVREAEGYLSALQNTFQEKLHSNELSLAGIFDDAGTDKYAAAERKALLDLYKFEREMQIKRLELRTTEDAPYAVGSKVNDTQKISDLKKDIIKAERDYELSQEDLTKTQIILINRRARQKMIEIDNEYYKNAADLRIKDLEKIRSNADESIRAYEEAELEKAERQANARDKAFDNEQSSLEKIRDQDLKNITDNFNNGLISYEEYSAKRIRIELDYERKVLESQIRFYDAQVKLLKAAGFDTQEAEAALAKAQSDLAELGLDQQIDIINQKKELNEELKESYIQLGLTIRDTFENLVTSAFEGRIAQIQTEIDKIEELKTAELARIDESTEAEEIKEARRKAVEDKAQAHREALERRQRNIERNKALFERTAKAFSISTAGIMDVSRIRTAAAVTFANAMATIPPPGNTAIATSLQALVLGQIPGVIGTTAANLVSLLAQPLPRFYTGTDGAPEGFAHTAEYGRELMKDPSGKYQILENPAIRYIKKGTKIYSNKVTEDILSSTGGSINHLLHTSGMVNNTILELDPVVNELKGIRKQSRIIIHNHTPIETTAYYDQQMKH